MHSLALLKFLGKFLPKGRTKSTAGFTLLELLVLVVIVGILSAIAVPGYLGFVTRQRLNTTQSNIFSAFRNTQSNAKRDKVPWQISFRNTYDSSGNLISQWAVHRTSDIPTATGDTIANNSTATAADIDNLPWNNFETGIRLRGFPTLYSAANAQATTCPSSTGSCTTYDLTTFSWSGQIYSAQFDKSGRPASGLNSQGKITMSPTKPDGTIDPNSSKACIRVSTLLGAIRTSQDTDCDN